VRSTWRFWDEYAFLIIFRRSSLRRQLEIFQGTGKGLQSTHIQAPNVQAAEFEVTDTSARDPEPLRQSLIDFFPRNRTATVNRAVFSSCYMSSEEAKDVGFGAGATQRALGNAESVSLQQIRTPGITCPG